MNLNQTILDAARDEVAKERGFSDFHSFTQHVETDTIHELRLETEAALLAMEKLAAFYEWCHASGCWYDDEATKDSDTFTQLELYNIWREATTQQ